VATQVGLMQFAGFMLADNGAGPSTYEARGKDHGGAVEFTWVMEGRSRTSTSPSDMAGGWRGPRRVPQEAGA
jgi:hypothetical protein